MARPAFARCTSARRAACGSSGSTVTASSGRPAATTAPSAGWWTTRAMQTSTTVTRAAVHRDTASTNQLIFSTSPVDTVTTSPAATRRVNTEPSSVALRASSCCTRVAVVTQLVTAARCRRVSPRALPAHSSASSPPMSARRAPERSSTAWTARPTQKGSAETEAKCSSPHASAFSCPPSWWRPSHHRNRAPERVSGTPGSGNGRSWMRMSSLGLGGGVRLVPGRKRRTACTATSRHLPATAWRRTAAPGKRFSAVLPPGPVGGRPSTVHRSNTRTGMPVRWRSVANKAVRTNLD